MNLKDKEEWDKIVEENTDSLGKDNVKIARRIMEILDEEKEFDIHKIICQAEDDTKTNGVTGFMAHCVANMVSQCHERGEEFRRKWDSRLSNLTQFGRKETRTMVTGTGKKNELGKCADCCCDIGMDDGPPDGWELEDGRTVCDACCAADTKRFVDFVINKT
ncbi:MAG: hypothetical protein GY821_12840 [Gammaproteobacteria bacterium]|nr:hypothetical protein [Gammaproteobacteria bacterium]